MKIILIYLPHPYFKQPDSQAPLGLLYLGAVLEEQGIEVEMKNYSSYSDEQAIEDLPFADIYGITTTSLELLQSNRFAKSIKDKYPGSTVFVGGPGTYTDEYVDWNYVDSICKGEAERTIFDMINDFERGTLTKIYNGEFIRDLDSLPLPARHLLKDKQGGKIFAYDRDYKGTGSTVLMTSRGCPFNCSFCSSPGFNNRLVRWRSPESVAEEVRHVIEKYNIRQFRFSDDTITANKKHCLKIAEMFGELDVAWRISTRVKPFDYDTFKVMHEAGLKEISFGVESFDDDILKILKKSATVVDNIKALELSDKIGIKARILMMVGTPGQTKKTIERNKYWIPKVPFNMIACKRFVPMPGSDIWDNPDSYNIEILNKNLDDYNFYFFGPEGMNEHIDFIRLKDRDMDEVNKENLEFLDFLDETGKLNKG